MTERQHYDKKKKKEFVRMPRELYDWFREDTEDLAIARLTVPWVYHQGKPPISDKGRRVGRIGGVKKEED